MSERTKGFIYAISVDPLLDNDNRRKRWDILWSFMSTCRAGEGKHLERVAGGADRLDRRMAYWAERQMAMK